MASIVQDVIDAYRGAGFEVRDDLGAGHPFAVTGTIDSAALLLEMALVPEPDDSQDQNQGTTMPYKAPNLEALQAECDAFNFDCRVGGRVAVNLGRSDAPTITTTRSPAQILSGHTAVVWLEGVSGCWSLGHVTPIPSERAAAPALVSDSAQVRALIKAAGQDGNIRDARRDLTEIDEHLAKSGAAPAVLIAAKRLRSFISIPSNAGVAPGGWTTTPPTDQGEYWHWNGDPDSAPTVLHILYSGTAKKCFVPMNQSYTGLAIMCDVYDGYWKRLRTPELPKLPA